MSHRHSVRRGVRRTAGRHRPGSKWVRPAPPRAPARTFSPDPDETTTSIVAMGTLAVGFLLAAALWPSPEAAAPVRSATAAAPVLRPDPGLAAQPTRTRRTPEVASCEPLGLRARVAQTILAGIPGTTMSDELDRLVALHAGSVLLVRTNIVGDEQVLRLTEAMRRRAPNGLLVAVDEEGGRVSRLGEKGLVEHLPSARTLAATATPEQVLAMGERVGRQMRSLGVDWNLAPVLDVTAAPDTTVIGDRSYGSSPDTAAEYARAFAEGLRAAGVLTTGKHFPGEGGTTVDPHETLPTLSVSRATLAERDLVPFVRAAPALDAVMAAHVVYPSLDPELPAGLSPAAAELLRGEVGFSGVYMTDALEMDAITEHRSIPEAAEMAVRAGVDVVLVGQWNQVAATARRLRDAVRSGRIDEARLDEAAGRVLAMKGYDEPMIGCLLS